MGRAAGIDRARSELKTFEDELRKRGLPSEGVEIVSRHVAEAMRKVEEAARREVKRQAEARIRKPTGGVTDKPLHQLSQAWVFPSLAGEGTEQTVWALGEENGGVRITSEGFWQLTAVGGATINPSNAQVAFNEWTHIAVSRGGGGATLRVNGSVAATATGAFGKWGDFLTLGADEDLAQLFNGRIDNFDIGGNHDGSFVPFTDLTFFSDLMIPQPTNAPGDVDQDGDADMNDYMIWSTNAGFNNTFGVGDVTTLVKGDVNNDGRIDFFDFTEIAAAASAAGAALNLGDRGVPEPTALFLAAFAAAALILRRW